MKKPLVISIAVHGALLALLIVVAGPAAKHVIRTVAVEVIGVAPGPASAPKISSGERLVRRPRAAVSRQVDPPSEQADPPAPVGPAAASAGAFATGTMPVGAVSGDGAGTNGRASAAGGGVAVAGSMLDRGSGAPGTAGGSVAGGDALAAIRGAIERMARSSYPLKARKLRMEGVATIGFRINTGGLPEGISVTSGSGFDLLDQAAVEIVQKAGPYPCVSEPVTVPIRFSLRQQ